MSWLNNKTDIVSFDDGADYKQPTFGSMSISRDGDTNLIVVTCRGFWTEGYADEHFAALERLADRQPDRADGVRVLVDLREYPVQPAAVATRVQYWTQRLYCDTDRVAILVSSSLVKAQMRRVTLEPNREFFLSASAARTWLLAYAALPVA